MQHLVKIGKTTRTAKQRAAELANATGVPGKFEVILDEFVADVDAAEALVHIRLREYRVQRNREFFNAPLPLALRAAFDVCSQVNKDLDGKIEGVKLLMGNRTAAGKVRDFLAPYRGGDATVRILFSNNSARVKLVRTAEILLSDNWRVDPSPRLLAELREWLGDSNVILSRERTTWDQYFRHRIDDSG